MSWIFAAPLFAYAGFASFYAETHLPSLLQFCRAECIGLPPMSLALISLGTPVATIIALSLAIALPAANILIARPRVNLASSILLLMLSVLFSSFVVLAVYAPEWRMERFLHTSLGAPVSTAWRGA